MAVTSPPPPPPPPPQRSTVLKLKAKRSTNQRSKQSNERLSARVSRAQNLQVQYQQQQSSRVESSLVLFLFLFLIWEGGRGLGSLNLFFLSFLFASFHSLLLPFCSSLALPLCQLLVDRSAEAVVKAAAVVEACIFNQPTNQPTTRHVMQCDSMQCNAMYTSFSSCTTRRLSSIRT